MIYSTFHNAEAVAALLREAADQLERDNDKAEQRKKLDHMIGLVIAHAEHLNDWRKWAGEKEYARYCDDRR